MAEQRTRAGWLAPVLAFALAVPIAALTAFVVFEALKAGATGGEPPRTRLAEYAPSTTGAPALPVAILGPDEERVPLPTLSYEQIEALSSPRPTATSSPGTGVTAEPTAVATGAPTAPDSPPTPSPSAGASATAAGSPAIATSPSPDEGAAGPGVEFDFDLRPSGIEVMTDVCMLHARIPGCPEGIPGTIIETLPPPPDFGSPDEIGFSDFALSALVNHDPDAPEYTEFADGGCAPPGEDGVSLLILTTEVLHYEILYWPVLYLPDGDIEPAETQMTSGDTIFERPAVRYRFYHCPRLFVGEEVLFEVHIRFTDAEGNVAWPPVYEFCLDCRTAPPGERLALASGYAVEVHPEWAAAILYAPPADGALEFAYRLPGGSWRSQIATRVRQHEEARVKSPPNLLPGTRYEYQLRLWPADGGPVYESPISSFSTLRRTIIVEAARFEVVDEGSGELVTIALELCGDLLTDPSTLTVLGECSGFIQAFYLDGDLSVEGRRSVVGGFGGAPVRLEIEDGDRVIAEFEPGTIQLTNTRANRLRVELWSSDGSDDCTSDCRWWVHFSTPPWFGDGLQDCAEGHTTYVLRTSPTARGFEPRTAYFVNSVGGPRLRPTQIDVCVMEVH